MNVVKCENSHFFDSDTYQACPVCGGLPANEVQQAGLSGKEKKKGGLFSKFKKDHPAKNEVQAGIPLQKTTPAAVTEQSVNSAQSAPQPSAPAPVMDACEDAVTVPMAAVADACEDAATVPMAVVTDACEDTETVAMSPVADAPAEPKPAPAEPAPSSLSDAIKQASANSEGKTASYFSAVTSGSPASSESTAVSGSVQTARPVNSEPVVGWLVCIEGAHIGTSFCIAAGKNSIGRSAANNIILGSDNAVSRDKHAILVYEPKKRNFYIQPGDSSGLTYLNDEYITESKKLTDRDIIEVGNSKLLFIPLCDEKFSWENYFSKEK